MRQSSAAERRNIPKSNSTGTEFKNWFFYLNQYEGGYEDGKYSAKKKEMKAFENCQDSALMHSLSPRDDYFSTQKIAPTKRFQS